MKLIYTAPNEAAARVVLDELTETWGARYPAMIRLWENAWAEFIPFLDYDIEIRTVSAVHERDRVAEHSLPAGGEGPRPLPNRTDRTEMPLPGHPIAGPNRERPGTMDDEVETSAERVRLHLRRPLAGSRNLLMKTAGNTVPVTDPRRADSSSNPGCESHRLWRRPRLRKDAVVTGSGCCGLSGASSQAGGGSPLR